MQMRMTLLAGVAALALSPAAFAQESTTEPVLPPAQEQAPAEQAPMDSQGAPTDPSLSDPSLSESATDSGSGAIGEVVVEPTVTPPPAEAVIQVQRPNEMRTENLIGATVYNADGEKVGKVKDILFDTSGAATGLVLSVGGIMGLGAKDVGLTWDEVDVDPQPELVRVNYTKEQLEAAPSFKTQEAVEAESGIQEPVGGTATPEPAPEPTE